MISNCKAPELLEPLVNDGIPVQILKAVLKQFSKILPNSSEARIRFVSSGALMRLQSLSTKNGIRCRDLSHEINSLFPEGVVAYYSATDACAPILEL